MICSNCNAEIPSEKERYIEKGKVLCPKCRILYSEKIQSLLNSVSDGKCDFYSALQEIDLIIRMNESLI